LFPPISKGIEQYVSINQRIAVRLLFPALNKGEKAAYKYIAPLIEERRNLMQRLGPNDQKPVHFLQSVVTT
jgi:hypothetical protein